MAAVVFHTARVWHGEICSEKTLPCKFATCSAISGTRARSLLLLLGLPHVLFTLVYLISWRKSCMALAGLLLAVAAALRCFTAGHMVYLQQRLRPATEYQHGMFAV